MRAIGPLGGVFLFLYLQFVVYVMAYLAMMVPQVEGLCRLGPTYRFGGEVSHRIFEPVHAVDQMIRPRFWHSGSRK